MKKYIAILSLVLVTAMCAFPADIDKNEFNLVAKVDKKPAVVVGNPTADANDLIYLKARIKELEAENKKLKSFGRIYIDELGTLHCKSNDEKKDWDWDGENWKRGDDKIFIHSSPPKSIQQLQWTFPQSSCPNGRCPNTR